MERTGPTFGAFVGVALLLAGCAEEPTAAGGGQTLAPGTLTLAGVVVDEALRPVAGANVTAGDGRSATTGTAGEFSFAGLEPGVYVVQATKTGFAAATTQVVLAETQESPLVKLVLVADVSDVAYAETYAIDGFVECGVYFVVGFFAACSAPNTASTIACPATGVCAGNVTGDRSLILLPIERQPDWVQMEAAWEATTETSRVMMVQSGATTRTEVASGGLQILNETVGPSPNLNILAGKTLEDSSIGVAPDSLLYMRLHTAPNPPANAGLAVQQPFKLLIHVFYGYTPTPGWRFSEDPTVPPPPA
jgi:hypothetical protein